MLIVTLSLSKGAWFDWLTMTKVGHNDFYETIKVRLIWVQWKNFLTHPMVIPII